MSVVYTLNPATFTLALYDANLNNEQIHDRILSQRINETLARRTDDTKLTTTAKALLKRSLYSKAFTNSGMA